MMTMNNQKKLLSLYGLKWNPFSQDLPIEALVTTPRTEHFLWRIESLVLDGGFGLLTGEPGLGKSVIMRLLEQRLSTLKDVVVAEIARPQSGISDFYRELGSLFGLELRVANKFGGFQRLRERWCAHIESSLCRPVLLIDEAQEMQEAVLSELRLLSSIKLDSQMVLAVVLAGDARLSDKLSSPALKPLASRIRTRHHLEALTRDELLDLLSHMLESAGAPKLMSKELMLGICETAQGVPRIMTRTANEVLMLALHKEATTLDEKLLFEAFPSRPTPRKRSHG
jgi:general secretion pathway protein A